MKVNEIFLSIDGEGIRTGSLATFIRLTGCNLRCSYCDTEYAFTGGKKMSVDEILVECNKYNNKYITLTGGEPLIHKDVNLLIDKLLQSGYKINIETNGSVDIAPYIKDGITITMDNKMLSSGVANKMLLSNRRLLRDSDVIKLVCAKNDLNDIKQVIDDVRVYSNCWIYLSPVLGQITASALVDYLKELDVDTSKVRVQIQLHKVIWDKNQRGV